MSQAEIKTNVGEGQYVVTMKKITTDTSKAEEDKTAWCADYSTELTGTVAIADVPGEMASVNIRPGYSDNAAWDKDRDKSLVTVDVLTPWEFCLAAKKNEEGFPCQQE